MSLIEKQTPDHPLENWLLITEMKIIILGTVLLVAAMAAADSRKAVLSRPARNAPYGYGPPPEYRASLNYHVSQVPPYPRYGPVPYSHPLPTTTTFLVHNAPAQPPQKIPVPIPVPVPSYGGYGKK